MGILDVTGRVLTVYKADVTDHREKVKQLTGDQKALAQAELDAAKARNKQVDDWTAGLGKVAVAVGAVSLAYSVAKNSIEETLEFQKQAAASAGFDIESLQDAAGGLKDDMELMRFAAQTSRGEFKLSQQQMETFQQAIRAFSKDGFDAKEVTDAWTDALISGRTRGLKQFGIEIDETKDKQAKLTEMLKVAQGEIDKYGGNLEVAGDDLRRVGVAWDDFKDSIKHGIGEGILAAVDGLHAMREGIRGVIDGMMGISPAIAQARREMDEYVKSMEHKVNVENADITTMLVLKNMGAISGADISRLLKEEDAQVAAIARSISAAQGVLGIAQTQNDTINRLKSRRSSGGSGRSLGAPTDLDFSINAGSFGSGDIEGDRSGFLTSDIAMYDERMAGGAGAMFHGSTAGYGAFQEKRAKTWLEGAFGKLDEFDAYSSAIKTLTDSMNAAYEAWATGSMSAGEAFKKAIGSGIAAMGANMFVHGLQESAMAVADLFINPAAAASHALAAGEFFAGAAAAGVIARQFGGSPSTSSAGSGASGSRGAPSTIGAGGGASQPAFNATIIIGDEFADDTPFRRQKRAAEGVAQARRRTSGSGVVWE